MNLKDLLGAEGRNRVNGAIALAIVAMIVLGCTCGKDMNLGELANKSASTDNKKADDSPFGDDETADGMPGDDLLKALVNETTADFAYAISTNDFSNIHKKASIDFQRSIPLEKLQTEFKKFVDQKSRYLPSLAKISSTGAEFSPAPSLRQEQGLDILVAKGKYATKPVEVGFDYEYVKRDGQWKLLKLVVKL